MSLEQTALQDMWGLKKLMFQVYINLSRLWRKRKNARIHQDVRTVVFISSRIRDEGQLSNLVNRDMDKKQFLAYRKSRRKFFSLEEVELDDSDIEIYEFSEQNFRLVGS
jgi:hypothetical protein